MKDFVHENFDKLLLTFMLLVFCAFVLVGGWHGGGSLATFGTDQAKEFGGALLGLITGHALAKAEAKTAASAEPKDDQ